MGAAVFVFTLVVGVLFVSSVVSVFAIAVKDGWRAGKGPIELPEWTGRERESLRADLEAAKKAVCVDGRQPKVIADNEKYLLRQWVPAPRKGLPCIAHTYGLLPEALEAFMEHERALEEVSEERIVRLPDRFEIDSKKIGGRIDAFKIRGNAVTTAHIADNAVTTPGTVKQNLRYLDKRIQMLDAKWIDISVPKKQNLRTPG